MGLSNEIIVTVPSDKIDYSLELQFDQTEFVAMFALLFIFILISLPSALKR